VEAKSTAIDGGEPLHYYADMKRNAAPVLALLVALVAPVGLSAQSLSSLEKVMDLTATIKTLAEQVAAGNYEAPAKFVILNGTFDSVFETDEATGTVVIELVSGEWIGLEDVRSYHCLIRFTGAEYLKTFPATPPRNPGPEIFAKSARLLVVAAPYGVVELADGRLLWLLDGVYHRRL
jgi:hypothetical protein